MQLAVFLRAAGWTSLSIFRLWPAAVGVHGLRAETAFGREGGEKDRRGEVNLLRAVDGGDLRTHQIRLRAVGRCSLRAEIPNGPSLVWDENAPFAARVASADTRTRRYRLETRSNPCPQSDRDSFTKYVSFYTTSVFVSASAREMNVASARIDSDRSLLGPLYDLHPPELMTCNDCDKINCGEESIDVLVTHQRTIKRWVGYVASHDVRIRWE